MKLEGIKTEYNTDGDVKRIIIDADAGTELVEDLIDTIVYEERRDGEYLSQDEAMEFLRKHGKI